MFLYIVYCHDNKIFGDFTNNYPKTVATHFFSNGHNSGIRNQS